MSARAASQWHVGRDPTEISVLDIVEAVQGPVFISSCEWAGPNNEPCPRHNSCYFGPLWCSAENLA